MSVHRGAMSPFPDPQTMAQGSARVNDVVELPTLREKKKIKSMQIFKKAQQQCFQVPCIICQSPNCLFHTKIYMCMVSTAVCIHVLP